MKWERNRMERGERLSRDDIEGAFTKIKWSKFNLCWKLHKQCKSSHCLSGTNVPTFPTYIIFWQFQHPLKQLYWHCNPVTSCKLIMEMPPITWCFDQKITAPKLLPNIESKEKKEQIEIKVIQKDILGQGISTRWKIVFKDVEKEFIKAWSFSRQGKLEKEDNSFGNPCS